MRVAIINSVYGSGSTGKIVAEIENRVKQNGDECLCFYGRKTGNEQGREYFGSNLSVTFHALFSRIFGKQGLWSNKATKQLIKKLEEFKPDVINLHNIHGYYLNYKILFNYLNKTDIKVYWTLHDLWSITGHCAYFEDCNYVNECKKCKNKGVYPKAFIDNTSKNFQLKKETFSSLKNLTLICPSQWIKNQMDNSFLRDKEKIVINNGINLNNYKVSFGDFKEKYGLQNKKILLGVSLQWSERKGLDTFNKLANDLPEDYKIVLIGINGEEVNKKILALPKTSSLNELVNAYSSSDIFVNPTVMENLPTVNIEALACGTPVITYNTGGSAEIIDENSGIAVQKGDYQGLLQAILNFDFGKYTSENCINRANNFDKEKKYKEYYNLFKGE